MPRDVTIAFSSGIRMPRVDFNKLGSRAVINPTPSGCITRAMSLTISSLGSRGTTLSTLKFVSPLYASDGISSDLVNVGLAVFTYGS